MTELYHEGSAPERAINLEGGIIKSLNMTHVIRSLLRVDQVWFQILV